MFIIIITALTAALFAPADGAMESGIVDNGGMSFSATSTVMVDGDSLTAYVG